MGCLCPQHVSKRSVPKPFGCVVETVGRPPPPVAMPAPPDDAPPSLWAPRGLSQDEEVLLAPRAGDPDAEPVRQAAQASDYHRLQAIGARSRVETPPSSCGSSSTDSLQGRLAAGPSAEASRATEARWQQANQAPQGHGPSQAPAMPALGLRKVAAEGGTVVLQRQGLSRAPAVPALGLSRAPATPALPRLPLVTPPSGSANR